MTGFPFCTRNAKKKNKKKKHAAFLCYENLTTLAEESSSENPTRLTRRLFGWRDLCCKHHSHCVFLRNSQNDWGWNTVQDLQSSPLNSKFYSLLSPIREEPGKFEVHKKEKNLFELNAATRNRNMTIITLINNFLQVQLRRRIANFPLLILIVQLTKILNACLAKNDFLVPPTL